LEGRARGFVLVIAIGVLSALTLLPMYPVFSLDIFYYMAADRIWSVYHENPFVVPPLQAAHDPFFPYTSWGHYTLPYGPLWPWISAATSAFGAGQIGPTLLAFKALGVLGYVVCLPVVSWAVAGLRPERRLVGTCIFAWNPLVLLELAGGGHNDAIALIPAALALGLWARRASIGTALAITLSFAVKATILVLAPALLWASFRRAVVARSLPLWLVTHVLPAGLLLALAWLPFWSDRSADGLARESGQYYQSLTAVLMAPIPGAGREVALKVIQIALFGVFGLYFLTQTRDLSTESPRGLRAAWRLLVLYFAIVAPFYAAWYMIWPTLLAAVLAERRTTLLSSLLCLGGLATYVVQFVVRPLTVPALGWAQINGLAVLVAYGPFLIGWWLTSERRPLRLAARPLRSPRRRKLIAADVTAADQDGRRESLHVARTDQ
jgi:hypothetical protein